MPILEDYYSILQVHFLAEPEVIESAYKRLARKYHPDINKSAGADGRMKKINEAYETLHDAARRRAYDAARSMHREPVRPAAAPPPRHDTEVLCPLPARQTLIDYFSRIKSRNYTGAYELVSELDKKNITHDDFVKWQSGVSRIYNLQEYALKANKSETNVRLGGHVFQQVIDILVTTVEQNSVMGRLEKDTIVKKVVLESGAWRIYVGFEDIRPYISRFEELCALLDAKSVLNDMLEHYSQKDSGTGLFNRKGFAEAAQREILRYQRYGNTFSVLLLEITLGKDPVRPKNQELVRHAAEWAGKILGDSFRRLDILGRWGELGFIILLPETPLGGCTKAARKIRNILEVQPLVYGKRFHDFKLNIGIDEFGGSLEDTIRNLTNFIDIAARAKGNTIVCRHGIVN
jgi:diguanylate cyclase (GGDEF)-like protein